jgi:hypothetical protein
MPTTYKIQYDKVSIPKRSSVPDLTAAQIQDIKDLIEGSGVQAYLQRISGWTHVDDDVETEVDFYTI